MSTNIENERISTYRFKVPKEILMHNSKILTKNQLLLCDDLESQIARYEQDFNDAKNLELSAFRNSLVQKLGEIESVWMSKIVNEINQLHSIFYSIFDTIEADCIEICHSALKSFWHDTSSCEKITSIVKDVLHRKYSTESSVFNVPKGYIPPECLADKLQNIEIKESSNLASSSLKITLGIGKVDTNYDDVFLESLESLKKMSAECNPPEKPLDE